jgi:hypothetical protein
MKDIIIAVGFSQRNNDKAGMALAKTMRNDRFYLSLCR